MFYFIMHKLCTVLTRLINDSFPMLSDGDDGDADDDEEMVETLLGCQLGK